jgi:hypothetical protein
LSTSNIIHTFACSTSAITLAPIFCSSSAKSKHSIDFNTTKELWNDQDRIEIQMNFSAENRNALVGKIEDKLWTAIFTRRVDAISHCKKQG